MVLRSYLVHCRVKLRKLDQSNSGHRWCRQPFLHGHSGGVQESVHIRPHDTGTQKDHDVCNRGPARALCGTHSSKNWICAKSEPKHL